jgi:hypothetical protein
MWCVIGMEGMVVDAKAVMTAHEVIQVDGIDKAK